MNILRLLLCCLLPLPALAQSYPSPTFKSVIVGAPTGGNMGPGATNAEGAYVNGVPLAPGFGRLGTVATGMKCDGVTDDAAALTAAYAAAQAAKTALLIPAGRCIMRSKITFDYAANLATGFSIIGAGPAITILDFATRGTVAAPNIQISCGSSSCFYARMENLSVVGNVAGDMITVGTGADQHNDLHLLNLVLQNFNTAGTTLDLNGVYTSRVDASINAGGAVGTSVSLKMQKVSMTYFTGATGQAAICQYMTTGTSQGNTFASVDTEVCITGIKTDSTNATNNTWIGGIFANNTYNFNFSVTPGQGGNKIINAGIGAAGTTSLLAGLGLTIDAPFINLTSTPAVPSSNVAVTNTYAQKAMVYILGGTVSAVYVNGAAVSVLGSLGVGLNPSDQITMTYSVAPSWVWLPVF